MAAVAFDASVDASLHAIEPRQVNEPQIKALPASTRVVSLDALRGFDMFWIIGGRELFLAFTAIFFFPVPAWLEAQFVHIPWGGFTFWDLIMPLFMFLVGTSMVFSFSRRLQEGASPRQLYGKLLKRALILWAIGMMAQGRLLEFDPAQLSFLSNTLQAIAIGYVIAGLSLLHLNPRGQIVLTALLLLGYWALMVCVPFGGHPAGTFTREANLAVYIADSVNNLFAGYLPNAFNFWISSAPTFAATVLLGVMAGHVLKMDLEPIRKLGTLVFAGLGCLALGWVWSLWFPMVKMLFSSTFVLWACGWSFLLLALFYAVIDLGGYKRWSFFFVVIGANAIVAYCFHFPDPSVQIQWRGLTDPFLDGLTPHLGRAGEPLMLAAAFAVLWGVLYLLYRNNKFFRV